MQIVPFAPKAPSLRKTNAAIINAALIGATTGFPVLSIMGKNFHITRGGDRTLVTKPGEDDPASSIEVVIVAANAGMSKVYYTNGYEDGSSEKPSCYSHDGKVPANDATAPQCKTCAACPQNQWGSKVNENGKKVKACSDSKRLAISPIGAINDPMLLRIPATTLPALSTYARELDGHGYAFTEVVTKISFDTSVPYPALKFKAVGVLPDDVVAEVTSLGASDLVGQITGMAPMVEESESAVEAPAAAVADIPKKPKAAKPAAPAPAVEAAMAKAEAKVDKADVAVEAVTGDDMDSLLDGTDFDD